MAANVSCPRVLAAEHCQEVAVGFREPLRTRILGTWWVQLVIFLFAFSFFLFVIPWIAISCHRDPRTELQSLSIRDLTAFESVSSAPDSPWQVTTHSNATFTTWNKNTLTKCFITYRRMDVRVEYRGQVILQQQSQLGFSLKPDASREFSVEMKGDHAQLKKDLGPVMRAEMRSGKITLTFFYDVRYLTSLRWSKWKSSGCVVIANLNSSHSGTMVWQECSNL